jgi:hypothetical protein
MPEGNYAELERRVSELEYRISQMLELVEMSNAPFTYLMIEADVKKDEVRAIYDLMDRARASLSTSAPMTSGEFEREIYRIIPRKDGDYHFAESIVNSLNDETRYTDVYERMRETGMNIGPRTH